MSYHSDMERPGKKEAPTIEMPPLPVEPSMQPESAPQETYEPSHPVAQAQETGEEQQELQASEPQEPVQPKEDPQQMRFKEIRQARERAEKERERAEKERERAERERDAYFKRLQEIESRMYPQQAQEEEIKLNPDDLVEWKHVEKKIKGLEAQMRQQQQQAALSSTETRLKVQYPDFDSVVSEENISILRTNYPEIAETLRNGKDYYNTGVTAYTLIKKLGIAQDTEAYNTDKLKAQQNSAKPRPLTSIAPQMGESPMSRANVFANGLTDDLRKQLYKEMQEASKNRNR